MLSFLFLVAAALAAKNSSVKFPSGLTIDDTSFRSKIDFTPSKTGMLYFEGPAGIKFSKCVVPIKESDLGKTLSLSVGGVPVFDGTPSANVAIKAKFYEKNPCVSEDSSLNVVRKISAATVCTSIGDPHFKSSFGATFDSQGEGYFTLFQSGPLTVQVFHKEFNKLSVNQAVAIKYGDEVLILDVRGKTIPATFSRAFGVVKNLNYVAPTKSNPVHEIKIGSCSSRITVEVNTWQHGPYMNIAVYAAAVYSANGIDGFCGAKAKPTTENQYAVPDNLNLLTASYQCYGVCRDPPAVIKAFAKNSPKNDLEGLVNCAFPISKDGCVPIFHTVRPTTTPLPTYTTYTTPKPDKPTSIVPSGYPATTRTTTTRIITDIFPRSTSVLPVVSTSTTTAKPSISTIIDILPTSITSSVKPSPTYDAPKYNETVNDQCSKVLSAIKCENLVDVNYYINSCKLDCKSTGSLDTIEAIKRQMILDCKSRTELRKCHPDPIKAAAAETIQRTLGINENKCLNNCSNQGKCASTGCICKSGFSGLDCGTNLKAFAAPSPYFFPAIVYPESAPNYGSAKIEGEVRDPVTSNTTKPETGANQLANLDEPSAPVAGTAPTSYGVLAVPDDDSKPLQTETAAVVEPTPGGPVYSHASPLFTTFASLISISMAISILF